MDGGVKSDEGEAVCANSLNGDGEKDNGGFDESNGELLKIIGTLPFFAFLSFASTYLLPAGRRSLGPRRRGTT